MPASTTTQSRDDVPRLAYSVAEAAAALGVCRQHLYDLIARGVIRTVKLGDKTRRISAAELDRILDGGDAA